MATPEDVDGLLGDVAAAALAGGRDDLAARISDWRERLAAPDLYVVVAGEFKAGKSSLVNALVDADICPVDDDVATSVPTLVRFSPEPGVRARRDGAGGEAHEALDRVAAYATEAGNPANRESVQVVEVGIPSPLLRDGLVLVDTPGVGGLRSAYASATMTALAMAHAVVFVSDASQEYTRSELDFLADARRLCPDVVAVLSKVDVVPEWRRICELNEGWLAQVGLGGRPVPTSSALHRRGHREGRGDLREESGMAALTARLAEVAGRSRATLAAAALDDARAVLGHLDAPLRAEHDALADPVATIRGLERARDRARVLTSDPEWSAVLEEGITELEERVDRDLAARMKSVLADAEQTVATTDPATNWEQFEAALSRQVSAEISAVAVALAAGADDLAGRLAREFAGHEAALAPAVTARADLSAPGMRSADLAARGASRRGVLVEAGWGGLEALGVLGSILTFTSISLFNPFSLVIGAFIGGKSLRDSRRREVEARREQARAAVTLYLDEATEAADRELKSTTRRLRRELRTTYQRQVDALLRSAEDSLAAAERTLAGGPAALEARRPQLAARLDLLESLRRRVDAAT